MSVVVVAATPFISWFVWFVIKLLFVELIVFCGWFVVPFIKGVSFGIVGILAEADSINY